MNNTTAEELQLMAYDLIRAEVYRSNREISDSELANYVRGVVDMQTELYMKKCKKTWAEVMGDAPLPLKESKDADKSEV